MEHHFLSQFYLRAFRDLATPMEHGAWVWEADLRNRRIRRQPIRKVGKASNYYTFFERDGKPSQAADDLLQKRVSYLRCDPFTGCLQ